MGYADSTYNDVVAKAKALCGRAFVETVDDHYAVYWDELGLSVKLRDDALDADVIALRNDMLALLTELLPDGNPHFSWTVGFRRKKKTIEVLFPGDGTRDVNDTLHPV